MTPPSRSSAAGSSAIAASRVAISAGGASASPSMSSSTEPSAGSAARTFGSASSVARRPASSRGRTWRRAMRAPIRSTSDEMAQRLAQRAVRAAEQRGDRVVAVDRDAAIAQRLRQPVAQRPAAHAGDAEIDRRQQRRRVAAAQRPRQLEVAVA